jgi:hypothetical protein
MYAKTFMINGVDLSAHVHKRGPQFIDTPVFGLPEKMTLDGVTHVDYKKHKSTIVVPFNPSTPEDARIISNLCKSGILFVTTYNPDDDADVTYTVKPVPVTKDPALTKAGEVSHYRFSNIAFQEL